MQKIKRCAPESMTVTERMDEVASLLARGISRLRDQSVEKSANVVFKSHLGLGFSGHQSVHRDTVNYGVKES